MPELAADNDTIVRLLRQRQLQEFAASKFNKELDTLPNIDPDSAVEFVFEKDFTHSGMFSGGPVRYLRGQHITYPPVIRELRTSGAPMVPVR